MRKEPLGRLPGGWGVSPHSLIQLERGRFIEVVGRVLANGLPQP